MRRDPHASRYLDEIGAYPALGPEAEREAATRARAGDREARGLLIRSNLRCVAAVAAAAGDGGRTTFMERVAAGNLALVESVDRFDPGRGVRLSTYASRAIRGAMVRDRVDLAGVAPVPKDVRALMARAARGDATLTADEARRADLGRRTRRVDPGGVPRTLADPRGTPPEAPAVLAEAARLLAAPGRDLRLLRDRLAGDSLGDIAAREGFTAEYARVLTRRALSRIAVRYGAAPFGGRRGRTPLPRSRKAPGASGARTP